MDKSIVVVEESQWRSDVVKPLGSLVQINSIAIDLGCAMEEIDSPMHEHFSIRAFVAGMRKKDSKTCLSFASEGGGGGGDDGDLPPLSIPKFQWWKCSTCVPKTSCPHDDVKQTIGGESENVNEEDDKNNQLILYNPPCNEGLCSEKETDVSGNAHADVVAGFDTFSCFSREDANIRADEPKNVSTECDELSSKRKPKLRSLADIMHNAENIRAKSAFADLEPHIRAPHKNRKLVNVVEEDRGPLETASASKRSKGPISVSVKNKAVDTDIKTKHMKNSKRRVVQIGEVPKISAEDIPSTPSFVSGKQVDRASDLSRTEVERSCDGQTSCRHRGIPDLNESITEKPSMMQGNEFPALTEIGSSARHRYSIAKEGKRKMGLPDPQAVKEVPNTVEHGGTSDDIPMEIVELLAMNQRERALGNSRNHFRPVGTSSPAYVEGRPGMINFSFANARRTGASQGMSNFPQTNRDESQFSLFGSFKPSQQKKASSLVLEARPAEGADLLWPSRRNNVTQHTDVHQRRLVQPNGLSMHSFSDHQRYKGKTVAYMNNEDTRSARDAYSNDTIPAMQLLSLMDRGVASSSNDFLDKPPSPFNLHRRLNGNEKQFFAQSRCTKDFPTLLDGVCYSGERSKRSYTQGQMPPHPRKIHLGGPSNRAIQSLKGNVASEVCTLNKNPADFSYPDVKNEFTISAKDLKLKKRKSLKESSPRHVNVDDMKRRNARKAPLAKIFPVENSS
ncbi:hypothetical protein ACS0TY_022725 [Phlomoides rotata]